MSDRPTAQQITHPTADPDPFTGYRSRPGWVEQVTFDHPETDDLPGLDDALPMPQRKSWLLGPSSRDERERGPQPAVARDVEPGPRERAK